MAKMMRSFRFKMIALLGLSLVLSGAVTFLLYKILQLYYTASNVQARHPLARLRQFIYDFGDLNFFLLFFVPLAILLFFILTKPYAAYFNEISAGIRRLASGDFSGRVEISAGDEFRDIADDVNLASKKLQEAIERGDFAESSKDQLILNLAHDLRTPLTSVLGYLDIILRDDRLTKEQVHHFMTIAYTKSQRLEKLIDELFEITRMNYGRLTIERKPIDLSELLVQLSEELYPLFEKNRLTARLNADPHLQIQGDGDLLARVFENLLTNAARYGKDGKFVDIQCHADEGDAVVQVINYGDRIPAEELPRLFDMFYTVDKARTHKEGGTGLGLFIAKNIIEQHGGAISAQSDVIRTAFEVRLPRSR